jgi:hypothetical protein
VLGITLVPWMHGLMFVYWAIPQAQPRSEKLYLNTSPTEFCLNTENTSTERIQVIKIFNQWLTSGMQVPM